MLPKKYLVIVLFFSLFCFSNRAAYVGDRKAIIDRDALFYGTARLETPRLILRQLTLADAQDMFAFTSDPEVETWDALDKTIDDTRAYIINLQEKYSSKEPTTWGIEHKQDKKIIGYCGFSYFDANHALAELEYALAKPYWHQGLMSEALAAVLKFAFTTLKINRIFAYTHLNNYRSIFVLSKLGFSYEGIHRECGYSRGAFWNLHCFVLLRDNYLSNRTRS
jgi:[ribosomal protein S5]-alanine N-acetyltransferase